LADGLRERGLVLALAENRYDEAELARLCREFLALRPRGLVLHDAPRDPVLRDMLTRSGVPVVEVGDLPKGVPLDRAVSFSNEAAAAALTRHLIGRGYRRIGLLTLPPTLSQRAARRVAGWGSALAEAGLPHRATLIVECDAGYAGGAAGLRKLLRSKPDAVIGGGDVLGLGALLEAQRRGLRVPGDLAVVSFDHYELVEALTPRLTTLRLPRREIGLRAAAALAEGKPESVVDLGFDLSAGDGD
jgi:LacI family gluconate utilization system Gnt-I transcriptional repressor